MINGMGGDWTKNWIYEKRDHNSISREKDASPCYKTFFLISSNELLILTNRNPLLTGMWNPYIIEIMLLLLTSVIGIL